MDIGAVFGVAEISCVWKPVRVSNYPRGPNRFG